MREDIAEASTFRKNAVIHIGILEAMFGTVSDLDSVIDLAHLGANMELQDPKLP